MDEEAKKAMTTAMACGLMEEMAAEQDARNHIRDILRKARDAEKQQATLENIIQEKAEELARINTTLAGVKSQLQGVQAEVTQTRNEHTVLTGERDDLRRERDALASIKSQLESNISTLKQTLNVDMVKDKATKEQALQRLEAKIQERESVLGRIRTNIAEARKLVGAGEVTDG